FGSMKQLAIFGTALCFVAVQSYAATKLSGKLMDAGCYNEKKVASHDAGHKTYHSITKTCAATQSTTAFAVRVTSPTYQGDTINLEDQGNSMAAAAMRDGALQPDSDGDVHVRVAGKMEPSELLLTKSVKASGRHKTAAAPAITETR